MAETPPKMIVTEYAVYYNIFGVRAARLQNKGRRETEEEGSSLGNQN